MTFRIPSQKQTERLIKFWDNINADCIKENRIKRKDVKSITNGIHHLTSSGIRRSLCNEKELYWVYLKQRFLRKMQAVDISQTQKILLFKRLDKDCLQDLCFIVYHELDKLNVPYFKIKTIYSKRSEVSLVIKIKNPSKYQKQINKKFNSLMKKAIKRKKCYVVYKRGIHDYIAATCVLRNVNRALVERNFSLRIFTRTTNYKVLRFESYEIGLELK